MKGGNRCEGSIFVLNLRAVAAAWHTRHMIAMVEQAKPTLDYATCDSTILNLIHD
jgi:hypothetical protein